MLYVFRQLCMHKTREQNFIGELPSGEGRDVAFCGAFPGVHQE
ncbi:hypothetical protein ACMD2_19436 [Ananas comosus]|uniref:Uncharacterized protein n=1 Tax=Ananas comosus TaxID=4615 RepID=A0A199UIH0_ANACO|nr:hypothetical protein ACMD2_19436 [Ananas comosus]